MVHNIYFSVCGEGYGHSSRDMAIAKELIRESASVLLGSYGYVLERLKQSFDAVEVEKEFEMAGKEGAFDLKATISRSKSQAFQFSKIISQEKKIMEDFNATCVVADGRTAAVFAAFKIGIPCIIISNQTSIEPFFKDSKFFLRFIGKQVEFTLKTSMALAEFVLIPDFPPPNTVCLHTLSKSRHVMKKQVFAGPIVNIDEKTVSVVNDMQRPYVLTLLGGHSFRLPIFISVLKIAQRFPDVDFLVFTKFKSNDIPKNVIIREFAKDISQYIQNADLIITQAGHSTAMEILALGKPALIIPDEGQIEQENNASRMKELGVCENLEYSTLEPESLFQKISMLLNDPGFREKARQYSIMSKTMKGSRKASGIILELSNRIQCY
jgi:UDP-N-acetylglucosamine--N-acetylmuramyl-(pentapeptide) pyrophosphoryl-undecaprenol N-acetylglucosamine transferase